MAENQVTPPQDVEAEKAVLGALLTVKDAMDDIDHILEARDFYRNEHRIIYEAIQTIYREDKHPDLILLTEELNRTKQLDAAGGISYITAIAAASETAYNRIEHANIVRGKAQLRRLIDAGHRVVGLGYSGEETPDKLVSEAEALILRVGETMKAEESFSPADAVVWSSLKKIDEWQAYDGVLTGLPTGFRGIDELTRGLQRSDLILVAARPSVGKTAFTLNIAQNVAVKTKRPVAFFSLEMSEEQLMIRMLSSLSGVSSQKLKGAQLNPEEWLRLMESAEVLSKAPLYIDDTSGITYQDMRAKLRRLKAKHGLSLVVIDYLQLMEYKGSRGSDNRQQQISEISRNLKLIAREMDVPVIALSQLSRAVENRPDKRPVLSDLRESGSLEQDADIVAFLYREDYQSMEGATDDGFVITEVLFRKHRNGALGKVSLGFEAQYTRFRDVTAREPEL